MNDLPPILVVDDEPLIRLAIRDALEEGGYHIVEAENGNAALDYISGADELRGVVTDIRMEPGPDGWEVAHRAREKFASLAVVYVTGDSLADWTANGVPLSTALQKPFANAELVTALANLLVAHPPSPPHP